MARDLEGVLESLALLPPLVRPVSSAMLASDALARDAKVDEVSRDGEWDSDLLLSGSCLWPPADLLSPPAGLLGSDLLAGGAASPEEPRSELAQPRDLLPW